MVLSLTLHALVSSLQLGRLTEQRRLKCQILIILRSRMKEVSKKLATIEIRQNFGMRGRDSRTLSN